MWVFATSVWYQSPSSFFGVVLKMARRRQQRLEDVYDREMEQQRINQYMDERFERYEQMMNQLTKRIAALIGNQNPVHPIQYYYNRHGYSDEEVSDDEEEENYCEEKYYEQNLFFDTDDGEDEDADIGDEPIFDEEDDGQDEFTVIGDEPIFVEEDENDEEYDMPELVEHVEYIDFFSINKILYFCVPLISILKKLQVDGQFMTFYAFMSNFLS